MPGTAGPPGLAHEAFMFGGVGRDAMHIGGIEPRSGLVAHMSAGGSAGGRVGTAAPSYVVAAGPLTTNLAPRWLNRAIVRSGVENFVFRSIAQQADQLADWNLAVRIAAANPKTTYARTLGQRLTASQARPAFNDVNREFFELRGIAGAGTHNVHHWNALSRFPELALDPRNLYLLESAIMDGRRVGEHIFAHWASRSGNPYRGPVRPGAEEDFGWARSVLDW
jgi:hypothetical protein